MSPKNVWPGAIAAVHVTWLDDHVQAVVPATPETVAPAGNVNVNDEIVCVPVFWTASLVAYPSTPHWAQSERSPVVPHTVSPNALAPTRRETQKPATNASGISP